MLSSSLNFQLSFHFFIKLLLEKFGIWHYAAHGAVFCELLSGLLTLMFINSYEITLMLLTGQGGGAAKRKRNWVREEGARSALES